MKILFEHFSTQDSPSVLGDFISRQKIGRLLDHQVSTIFLISSDIVESETYLGLVHAYREAGFTVHTIHLDSLEAGRPDIMLKAVEKIDRAFATGNCYILSYGKSYALTIITCFYMFTGKTAEESKRSIGDIRKRLLKENEDDAFIHAFSDYMREKGLARQGMPSSGSVPSESAKTPPAPAQTPAKSTTESKLSARAKGAPVPDAARQVTERPAAPAPLAPGKPAGADQESLKTPKTPDKDKEKKEDNRLSEQEYLKISEQFLRAAHSGPFYRSLKFKLITIISSIIIVSMSGMIFIATYFFKNDNTVRVQENNLKFSEIISSKVASEIDKSILIASTMLKSSDTDVDSTDFNASDVLYSGLVSAGSENEPFKTIKSFYNTPVMDRYLLSREKVDDIQSRISEPISRSFKGETVVHNASQGLDAPVLTVSLPYRPVRGQPVATVLVLYLKLDTLLKAFQTSGIVKPFMVNDRGDIIAHPESAIVLSGGNLSKLPIVVMMMKSRIDNGQTRYADSDQVYYLASFKKLPNYGCGVISSVEEATAYQEVYNIQRRNIYLMIIMLSTAILIVFFFGRSITTPIIRLVVATKQIIQGNYHVNIRPTSKDEIGELTYSFIEMGKGLEEREKIKSAFGKFVNKEIADAAMRGELRLGGERKNVAIFFSDIRSFTSISEKLEPEEVVEFLNDYMTRMVTIIESHHGVVDKFIGDAIMATWGAILSKGNDTENAINASLLMRKELINFNRDRGGSRKPLIKIGCGINTGPVLAGQIGSEARMEYTVIGDAVNLASRIESLNKPFGTDILISEDAYEIVKEIFSVEKMQTIKVKGKEAPQQIFAVLGRYDDPSRIKTLDELRVLLGMEPQPFNRRSSDSDSLEEGEKKYEIIKE